MLWNAFEQREPTAAAALGTFDGLHAGHKRVLSLLSDTSFSVLSIQRENPPPALITRRQADRLLAGYGVRQWITLPLAQIRMLTPEEFVAGILKQELGLSRVSCGFNFRFGRNAVGDAALLQRLCAEQGIRVQMAPGACYDGAPVSSTRIREALLAGKAGAAAAMLGRPFTFDFPVVHGDARGRTLNTPTLNQPFPDGFLLPKFGAYAAFVRLDGKRLPAVCNIGVRPTVGSERPLAETFIPGFSGDLYGRPVEVSLLEYLRPEQKFSSLSALQEAIEKDAKTSERIFNDEHIE